MAQELSRHSDIELYAMLQEKAPNATEAFEELYDRLSIRVYKYCVRVMGSKEMAEDVFQETFIRFYKSAETPRPMTNVAGYILKTARNLCLNAKGSKHSGLTSLEEFHLPRYEDSYENKQIMEIVISAIDCLPIDYREAFVLREYDGLSYSQIAEILDISIATVKIRIFRAKQKIRKLLSPYLPEIAL